MSIAHFYLKSPVSALLSTIDHLAYTLLQGEFRGPSISRHINVPVSEVIAKETKPRLLGNPVCRPGVQYGKISLLLVDPGSLLALGALVIDGEAHDSESAVYALKAAGIYAFLVNSENYKEHVHSLLAWCRNNPTRSTDRSSLQNTYESRVLAELTRHLSAEARAVILDTWRPLVQVGMSSVIGSVNLRSGQPPTDEERNLSNAREFDALSGSTRGREIQAAILENFRRRSSFDLVLLSKTLYTWPPEPGFVPFWWPSLAIELDGPHHLQPKQMVSDHKKNTLCSLALFPILRLDLTQMSGEAFRKENLGWNAELVSQVHWDFFRFLALKASRGFSEFEAQQRYAQRMQQVVISAKKLMKSGVPTAQAISMALEVLQNPDQLDETEVDHLVDAQQREHERKIAVAQYEERYGASPNILVNIDDDNVLHGRLGNIRLPPLRGFCRVVGYTDDYMRELRTEFANEWLLQQSLAE